MSSAKDVVRDILNSLPDDCTLNDIYYHVVLQRKAELAMQAIENGDTYTREQALEQIKSWRERYSTNMPQQRLSAFIKPDSSK
jgi:hypothetical protein